MTFQRREGCAVWILVLLVLALIALTVALLIVPPRGDLTVRRSDAQDGRR